MTEGSRAAVPRNRRPVGVRVRATLPSVRTLLAIGAVLCAGVFVCIVGVANGLEDSALTLVEAIRIGLEQAPTLRQAEIELEIARLELNAEFSTHLVPTVNLNLSPPPASQQLDGRRRFPERFPLRCHCLSERRRSSPRSWTWDGIRQQDLGARTD